MPTLRFPRLGGGEVFVTFRMKKKAKPPRSAGGWMSMRSTNGAAVIGWPTLRIFLEARFPSLADAQHS